MSEPVVYVSGEDAKAVVGDAVALEAAAHALAGAVGQTLIAGLPVSRSAILDVIGIMSCRLRHLGNVVGYRGIG